MVVATVRQVSTQTHPAAARTRWRQVADQLRGRLPRVAALMEDAEEDLLAYLAFPEDHRVKRRAAEVSSIWTPAAGATAQRGGLAPERSSWLPVRTPAAARPPR